MEAESEIAKWYRGKAIFVTGATGFMGKVLLEKLLRSCPDVGPIYVLVREKKKMLSQNRVEDMLTSSLFDKVRASGINPTDRVIAIPGDVSLSGLGISNEDRILLQDTVSVVFHVAATVKFDEPLRIAVAMNLEGTKALLELCKGIKTLSAVVHVSTAYANCDSSVIKENVYPPPADPDKVLQYVGSLDDDALEFITPKLIFRHPNTYTFTKALAEDAVSKYSTQLPIVIVRPSIVVATWKEPQPGWVDSFNGPTALLAGAGKGLIRTIFGNRKAAADIVPVDVCINLFIAAAWEIGTRETTRFVPDVLVYNCVSGPFGKMTWGDFVDFLNPAMIQYAISDAFVVPEITLTSSRFRHMFDKLTTQFIPGTIADFFTRFFGGKPKITRYQSKLNNVATMLEFFTTNEWKFYADNVKQLKNRLNVIDGRIFDFDITKMNWKEYTSNYILGIRRNAMKEEDETIPAARARVLRIKFIAKTIKLGLIIAVGVYVLKFYTIRNIDLRSYFADNFVSNMFNTAKF